MNQIASGQIVATAATDSCASLLSPAFRNLLPLIVDLVLQPVVNDRDNPNNNAAVRDAHAMRATCMTFWCLIPCPLNVCEYHGVCSHRWQAHCEFSLNRRGIGSNNPSAWTKPTWAHLRKGFVPHAWQFRAKRARCRLLEPGMRDLLPRILDFLFREPSLELSKDAAYGKKEAILKDAIALRGTCTTFWFLIPVPPRVCYRSPAAVCTSAWHFENSDYPPYKSYQLDPSFRHHWNYTPCPALVPALCFKRWREQRVSERCLLLEPAMRNILPLIVEKLSEDRSHGLDVYSQLAARRTIRNAVNALRRTCTTFWFLIPCPVNICGRAEEESVVLCTFEWHDCTRKVGYITMSGLRHHWSVAVHPDVSTALTFKQKREEAKRVQEEQAGQEPPTKMRKRTSDCT